MINDRNYVVDVEAWKNASYPNYFKLKDEPGGKEAWQAYNALVDEWNLRTSGAGSVWPTLLYSIRAHKRGRVHVHDFDLEKQSEFLRKAEPLLRGLLKPRDEQPEEVRATA